MLNVEVDETLIGGVEHGGKTGRGAKKCIVAIAVEVKEPKGGSGGYACAIFPMLRISVCDPLFATS